MHTKFFKFLNFLRENKESTFSFEEGNYVIPFDFDGLTERQTDYLKSKPHFIVDDTIFKENEEYLSVGYNIPFKAKRFKLLDIKFDHKVLFIQFDLGIDTHGEPDTNNFFRGVRQMSELYPILINEKLPNTRVDFYSYSDIYRLKDGYYIKNMNIKDYDFVFFGFMSKHSNLSYLIVNYLEKNNVPILKYETYSMYDTKSFGYDLTESLGYDYIPTISTIKLNKKVIETVKSDFGFPLILKNPNLDRGTGVWKIETIEELVERFNGNSELMMIQKLIPNDGDTRVIVIKNKTELIVKRQVIDPKEFRSNVALGGKAVKTSLPDNVIHMCEDISRHVPVCDIIGFDILKDLTDGKYYVMEINISPHMATFCVVTGINLPGVIVKYITDNIKK